MMRVAKRGMRVGKLGGMRATLWLSAAVALFAAVSVSEAQQAPAIPNNLSVRLAGSNIIGVGMIPPLAAAWSRSIRLSSIRTEPGLDSEEYAMLADGAEGMRRLRIEVKSHGTPTGLEPLLRGQADIWMAARPVRDTDLDVMRRRALPSLPPLAAFHASGVENVIGLDAMAIITHPSNPVSKLTVAQLRDIFLGRITNWSALGGQNLPIKVFAPDPNFATFESVCIAVIGLASAQQCVQQMVPLAAPHFKSVDDLADTVAGDPAAIGWVGIVAKGNARVVQIQTECGGLHQPDAFAVKAEEYPLARRYFVYLPPNRPAGAAAVDFVRFMLSQEGQAALKEAGAVDLLPGLSSEDYGLSRTDTATNALDGGQTRVRATDVQAFEDAIKDSRRISITFRFREGTDRLDARAEADLGRLAGLMQSPAYAKSHLTLIGFSASRGDYLANRALSRDRAAAVRERLVGLGVKNVSSAGVGPASPVSCNGELATATLNQRVEAWVRKLPGD